MLEGELFKIEKLISSAVVIGICLFIWFALTKIYYVRLRKIIAKKNNNDLQNSNTQHVLFSIVRGGIIVVGIISVMSIYGINLTATVTGLGLASAIIGLALQDTIKDIFRGIGLMSDKFYDVGDVLQIDNRMLEVMAFTLRSTKMRDIDTGDIFTVFNGDISQAIKISGVQFIDVPIPYDTDYDYANEVLGKIASEIEKIDGIMICSYKGLQMFEESDILYRIKITSKQVDRSEMRRAALRAIKIGLDEANIQIPFNQLDVHIDK